ncbi:MAG: LysM peptidoglycan-binding domain-containing protein, partial [Chloroflexi bacterium]|nr:LysM peptidoglycan-binding domain-containing protein [Chloroflexota bacterium]
LPALLTILLTLTISFSPQPARAESVAAPQISTASELIDAVNALRASYGLPPYTPNSILMGIAQGQAEYNLSIGTITHASADGLWPFQRALLAGYSVLGGYFSENIAAGVGLSAEGAVEMWIGDDPHLNTMISSNQQDIGAGVAVAGNTYYYVIDCGLSTGGTPRPFTPPPSYSTPVATLIPNTPNADGSVVYIVKRGDTPLAIAIAYGVSLIEIYALNNLTDSSLIYPNQRIIVRGAYTPTPTQPTSTPTERPTITPWPTSSPTSTETPVPPTPTPSPGLPVSAARGAVTAIVVAALVIAALLALIGRKRK